MVFNSIPFAVFFICFFLLYWFVFKNNRKLQNILILAGSYIFYSWWDWRFLPLLIGTSLLNYYLGIFIAKTSDERKRKTLLYIGLLQGLGVLLFFKYYNFFISSFVDAFATFNIKVNLHLLQLLLPLGISFYTFRTISYLLDVNKNKIKPTNDWVAFFCYVAFFPSLISGPIDRAKLLLPQLEKDRVFNKDLAIDGLRQILWGLFKKIVVADNCADIANQIFDNYQNLPASSLLLGALFYTLQLYADFSGYSDMAVGFSKLLGINITKNFDFPFFSKNIAEYWRKWHISLTSFFTEYVFTPLSIRFRDLGNTGIILSILINFAIVGMWHGANWTFVVFGILHGIYFIPIILRGISISKVKKSKATLIPSFTDFRKMLATFILVMLTNIVFRVDSLNQAVIYFKHLFSTTIFSYPLFTNRISALTALVFSCVLLLVEWVQRDKEHALQLNDEKLPPYLKWSIYYAIGVIILWFGGSQDTFIYFQF